MTAICLVLFRKTPLWRQLYLHIAIKLYSKTACFCVGYFAGGLVFCDFFSKWKYYHQFIWFIHSICKNLIHVADGDSIITSVLWCITTCFYFCNYRMYWIMLDGVLWRRNELFCLEWHGLSSSRRKASALGERPFCNSGLGLLIGYRYSGTMGCRWFSLEWHLRPSQYKTIYQFVCFFIRKVQLHITLHAVYRALW